MEAFGTAKRKWEKVIVGDLPPSGGGTSACGNIPAVIDDLYICGKADPIDGPGRTLGSAGPTRLRQVNGKWLPTVGEMTFDTADLDAVLADGSLAALIIHEMGQ